jgi:hypothetical protein
LNSEHFFVLSAPDLTGLVLGALSSRQQDIETAAHTAARLIRTEDDSAAARA